jgi:putative membrane protein
MYTLRHGNKRLRTPPAVGTDVELAAILGPVARDLPADACRRTLAASHLPTAVGIEITNALRDARDSGVIGDYLMTAIDQNTQQLIDYIGGCERIHKTPIPFAYMVHVRRALILYCISLPLAIAGEFGWLTVPITFLVCYVFIGIEEIGVEIEDPFGDDDNDLPLEAICQSIERDLLDLSTDGIKGVRTQ